ncbi:MAG TPA: TonB-dependent receptor, partial [Chondromyces sp.]|nr:TonB-dependent receptor [Chondromyces sp.]
MRSLLHVTLRVVLGCTALTLPAVAQVPASIGGVVLSAGGDPVVGAEVELPELRRRTTTDSEGKFLFADLPAGEYLLSVSSPRFGGAVQRFAVQEGGETSLEISLDKLVHSGAISVTAVGVARGLSELTTPVDVLAGDDLAFRRQSTLGETLAQQPGVTSTSYGQGSSRPVIRGLGEDRIRILENGLDTGDVSSIGPDHAVSMDPLAAERVEVVRGPATVLWGANAIGGVVNVLDGRVPDRPATAPVTGIVELEAGSNADKLSGALKLDGGSERWAWHLDLYGRDQDDYSSPARRPVEDGEHERESDLEEEHEKAYETGTVENTWTEAAGATVGASYVTDRGFIGVAVGGYDTRYGIPGHHHSDEAEEHDLAVRLGVKQGDGHDDEEEGVSSDLEQRRVDLHSQLDAPFAGFSALRFSTGWRDYTHQEIEGDELGTQFNNRWTEARLDLVNQRFRGFEGTLGLHYVN